MQVTRAPPAPPLNRPRARAHPDRFRLRIDNLHTICGARICMGLEFNNCARQRFSLHGVDLTKFDGGGARDKEVIPSIPQAPGWPAAEAGRLAEAGRYISRRDHSACLLLPTQRPLHQQWLPR